MNDKVKYLKIRSKVRDVVQLLESTTHNAYPIVDTDLLLKTEGTWWPMSSLHNVNKQLSHFKNINKQLSFLEKCKQRAVKSTSLERTFGKICIRLFSFFCLHFGKKIFF